MTNRFWSLLTYRLPAKVDLARIDSMGSDNTASACPLVPTEAPKDQLLDKIVASEYCRPLTLHDLSFYCENVELSGENLQFHLDFIEYQRKWDLLPEHEQKTSPPFLSKMQRPRLKKTEVGTIIETENTCKEDNVVVSIQESSVSDAFSFVSSLHSSAADDEESGRPQHSRDRDYSVDSQLTVMDAVSWSLEQTKSSPPDPLPSVSDKIRELVKSEANMDWDPPCGQPLRKEVEEIVLKYLLTSSPQQLNLGYAVSLHCLTALKQTTHPTALQPAADHVRHLLTSGTLPNFLRHSANNANTPRKWSTFIAAVLTLLIVFILTVLNIVQRKPVAMRAIGIPTLWFGMTSLLASLRGSCFILFLRHRVQARPYEPLAASADASVPLEPRDSAAGHAEEESWMARWKRKSLFRKLLDDTHPTTGPYREMQDAIALQSVVGGFVITVFVSILVGLIPVLD